MISSGGISSFWIGAQQLYSNEVQQALDNYTGLSAKDIALINSIISNQPDNYALIDEMFLFPLGSNVEANGSIGLKGTIGDNSSGGTFDLGGNLFDGAEHFDSTVIPSALTHASLNDIDIQCFVTENLDIAGGKAIYGCADLAGSNSIQITQQATTILTHRVNSVAAYNYMNGDGLFNDETMYGNGRDDAADIDVFIDGAEVDNGAAVSQGLSGNSIAVGGLNNNGVIVQQINAKIAVFKVGASIGFNQALFNTVVRNSLMAYGTI